MIIFKSNEPQSSTGDEVFTIIDVDWRGLADDNAAADIMDGWDFGKYSSIETSKTQRIISN